MNFEDFKKKFEKKLVTDYPNGVTPQPLVSVCVQTFQHKNYIKTCLDSILMQQTNFPFEILLGEDESTDGTREICIEYAENFPDKVRLFLHHRENKIKIGGQPTGRFNFVYNLYSSKGKYIALCEGDDYWTDPLKLQKQVDFLKKNEDVNLCFHRANLLQNKSFNLHKVPEPYHEIPFSYIELLKYYNFIATASIMFRSPKQMLLPDWFSAVPFGDLALYKLISSGKNMICLNEVMCVYRIQENGIWSGLTDLGEKRAYLKFYEIINQVLDSEEKKIIDKKADKLIKEISKLKFPTSTLKKKGYYSYLKLTHKRKIWSLI
jgi:glycosyltransferase involved in cell wall biosynthesis